MGACKSTSQFAQRQQEKSDNRWARELNLGEAKKVGCSKMIVGEWGQAEDKSKMRGKGIIYVPDSFYYEGDIVEGEAEGEGAIFWEDQGISQYEGEFSNGQPHGQGLFENQLHRLRYKGQWARGHISRGHLEIKQLWFEINSITLLQNNKYKVDVILPDKSHYNGQALVDFLPFRLIFDGEGEIVFPTGNKYNGQWVNGQIQGQGTYQWMREGVKFKGSYRRGKKQGKGKYYLAERKYLEGQWVEGKKEGEFKVIEETDAGHKNNIFTCNFQNDQRLQ